MRQWWIVDHFRKRIPSSFPSKKFFMQKMHQQVLADHLDTELLYLLLLSYLSIGYNRENKPIRVARVVNFKLVFTD